MKIPPSIPIYGQKIKGCKITEANHMTTFFNTLRREYPEYAAIALHIRNEGKRTKQQMDREKMQGGFVTGASDIVIPGNPAFVCEMKSQSPRAKVSEEQETFLKNCLSKGSFVCIALGHQAAMEAFLEWKACTKL